MEARLIKIFEDIYKKSNFSLKENNRKPSNISKTKTQKYKKINYYRDEMGLDGYEQEDTYYHSKTNGYILDKEGNSYDLFAKSWNEDQGSYAGGYINYKVEIYYKDTPLIFKGYQGIFSHGHGTDLISDLTDGYCLEDYCAKHRRDKDFDTDKEVFEELASNGDADAKSYSQRKYERAQAKEEKVKKLAAEKSTPKNEKKSITIEGKSFCFTGKMDGYNRNELAQKVVDNGGEFKTSVSKTLDYLVIADPNSKSGKVLAALKDGVEIITPEEFLDAAD